MPTDQEIAQIARRIVDGLCRDLFERMPVLSAPRLVAESREFKDFKVEKAEAVAGVLKAMLNERAPALPATHGPHPPAHEETHPNPERSLT